MIFTADFNPIAISLGFVKIRWYSLAYLIGFLTAYYLAIVYDKEHNLVGKKTIEKFLNWSILAIILGGRFGYVFFYNAPYYLANPSEILQIWLGGMSFHGAVIGFFASTILFARIYKVSALNLADLTVIGAGFGVFLGRVANFINGELWGRATNQNWGVIFPQAGTLLRHPSQLYEAFFEGLILFGIALTLAHKTDILKHKGRLCGIMMGLYAIVRFVIEYFREPDAQIGLICNFVSLGQSLCLLMLSFALFVVVRS
jgi:phosphatidylglycerol:prolipoprotein diacylglycerol transferase